MSHFGRSLFAVICFVTAAYGNRCLNPARSSVVNLCAGHFDLTKIYCCHDNRFYYCCDYANFMRQRRDQGIPSNNLFLSPIKSPPTKMPSSPPRLSKGKIGLICIFTALISLVLITGCCLCCSCCPIYRSIVKNGAIFQPSSVGPGQNVQNIFNAGTISAHPGMPHPYTAMSAQPYTAYTTMQQNNPPSYAEVCRDKL